MIMLVPHPSMKMHWIFLKINHQSIIIFTKSFYWSPKIASRMQLDGGKLLQVDISPRFFCLNLALGEKSYTQYWTPPTHTNIYLSDWHGHMCQIITVWNKEEILYAFMAFPLYHTFFLNMIKVTPPVDVSFIYKRPLMWKCNWHEDFENDSQNFCAAIWPYCSLKWKF